MSEFLDLEHFDSPLPPLCPKLIASLVKLHAELGPLTLDSTNPHFGNKYASLTALRDLLEKPMAENGLCFTQELTSSPTTVSCTTVLWHASGERLKFAAFTLPVTKVDAQGYGSAATYARRYSLQAIMGIAAEQDDDAEGAVREPAPRKPSNQQVLKRGADANQRRFFAVLKQCVTYGIVETECNEDSIAGKQFRRAWLARLLNLPVADPETLTPDQWREAANALSKYRDEKVPVAP